MSIMYEEAQAWCRRGIGSRYIALCQGRDWRTEETGPETFIGVAGRARPGNGRTRTVLCVDCGTSFIVLAKCNGGRKYCDACAAKRDDARVRDMDTRRRRAKGQRERVRGKKAKVKGGIE